MNIIIILFIYLLVNYYFFIIIFLLLFSSVLYIVPIPIVNVTAESPRVPAHTDYNTALLTCSDILPLSSFNDEIAFDRVYTWYMDGVDVTGMATGPFDADEKESYGRLQIDVATTPGEAVFNCSVSISVPGDPIISANGSTSVEILCKDKMERIERKNKGRSRERRGRERKNKGRGRERRGGEKWRVREETGEGEKNKREKR